MNQLFATKGTSTQARRRDTKHLISHGADGWLIRICLLKYPIVNSNGNLKWTKICLLEYFEECLQILDWGSVKKVLKDNVAFFDRHSHIDPPKGYTCFGKALERITAPTRKKIFEILILYFFLKPIRFNIHAAICFRGVSAGSVNCTH